MILDPFIQIFIPDLMACSNVEAVAVWWLFAVLHCVFRCSQVELVSTDVVCLMPANTKMLLENWCRLILRSHMLGQCHVWLNDHQSRANWNSRQWGEKLEIKTRTDINEVMRPMTIHEKNSKSDYILHKKIRVNLISYTKFELEVSRKLLGNRQNPDLYPSIRLQPQC